MEIPAPHPTPRICMPYTTQTINIWAFLVFACEITDATLNSKLYQSHIILKPEELQSVWMTGKIILCDGGEKNPLNILRQQNKSRMLPGT